MISCGSNAIARASATRRAMPPEISAGLRCAAFDKPTACNLSSTKSCNMDSDKLVCSRKGNATFSNTDKSVNKAPC